MKSLLLLLFLSFPFFAQAKNCAVYLAENHIEISEDPSVNFISFLTMLYDKHILTDQQIVAIANGNFENPLKAKAAADSDHQIFYELFDQLLNEKTDKNKIQDWAKNFSKAKGQVQQEKKQAADRTKHGKVQMNFQRIEPGDLIVERDSNRYDIKLTTPFEMMSTHVTHHMWEDLIGKSLRKPDMKDHDDYPVVNLTWWSAVVFANRLSAKEGLPEVYDLSGITEWDGSVEEGTLVPSNEYSAEYLVKINAPNGNIYKAKGYRLPTVAEYIFAVTDRGRSRTKFFSDVYEDNLNLYKPTVDLRNYYEVANFLPYVIDGKSFYDFYGNANVWLQDAVEINDKAITSGTDPVATYKGDFSTRVVFLGYPGGIREIYSSNTSKYVTKMRLGDLGFRLVRSLEK